MQQEVIDRQERHERRNDLIDTVSQFVLQRGVGKLRKVPVINLWVVESDLLIGLER